MKRIQLVLLALLALSAPGMAQHYSLYGLEIYNPHFKNPAFTGAEKLVQADYLRYSRWYLSGNNANIMSTLPGTNSSVGFHFETATMFSSFGYSQPKEESLKYYNLGASYNHTIVFSEELRLHAGVRLNYGKLNFLPSAQLSDSTLQYDAHYSTMLGVRLDVRNWELGLSAAIPLGNYRYSLSADNTLERETRSFNLQDFYFFGRYESQSERRVTFDPVFGLDCRLAEGEAEWFGYAGGIVQIVDVVGLGITAGSLLSVSANVNILDRVQLMLGIYGGEKVFQSGVSALEYGFNPAEKQYFIQLRVNL